MKAYVHPSEKEMKCKWEDLNAVYKSDDMFSMMINADMHKVDITNPYVLMSLVELTTYHASFWPHTAKRLEALKDILKNDTRIQDAIKSNGFKDMLKCYYENWLADAEATPTWNTPGRAGEKKNIEDIVAIVNSLN